MKVIPPGKGTSPEAPEAAPGVASTEPGGKSFADAFDKAGAAGATGAAGAVSGARPAGGIDTAAAVADIGAALGAGSITPQEAVNQVIGRILDRQLGSDAPAEVRAKIESALRDALDVDPVLASKVRQLAR